MISEIVRKSERLALLDVQVGEGRPKGMHERTYQRLRGERSLLRAEVGDRLVASRATYAPPMHTRWFSTVPIMVTRAILSEVAASGLPLDGSLVLAGYDLFAGEALEAHLQHRLEQQADAAYQQLALTCRRVSGLQVRRAMTQIHLPSPVTIVPSDKIEVVGRLDDGRLYAEHRSMIMGDEALLAMSVEGAVPSPLPRGTIAARNLVIGVVYEPEDADLMPLLVQATIQDVDQVLRQQRVVTDRFRARLEHHVREAVKLRAAYWQKVV